MADTKKYRGNCRCGAFIFEMEMPEIKSAMACRCSICLKKAYLWLLLDKPPKIVKGEGTLVGYEFGNKKMTHQFCENCGTAVMAVGATGAGINVSHNFIFRFNGDTLDPQYVPPAYSGPEPNPAGFAEGKTYYGSCHCGAVTATLKVKGSLDSYEGRIIECNCSLCQRGGYIWIYPLKDQIAIQGTENLSYYVTHSRVGRIAKCKTCGVQIFLDLNPLTDEEIAALPEDMRKRRAHNIDVRPFNLRVLNNFDLESIKPVRHDGYNTIKPAYVNP
ncbi:hypothetical protein N656DRAFT_710317 [Canariomyces notabilis]|uniref:CENP-V/GFA domain-containing protein n=1 Tax=Canariomyces notabilis TaxID=2074819 RepID=A0AAN6YRK6_9PEZI|nr:hypothetical protein N656DRAFT_710317 [Canariomyces arenarius]